MTQDELKLKVDEILNKHADYAEWATDSTEATEEIMKLINQHVKEVIGEDEESEYSQDNINISAERNYLKQEQRKRAGL